VADYLASGGISDAITRTAEGVFGGLPADQQQMARRLPAHPSLVATITGPNGHVYSVAFSHSGQVVAAGSADGTVRLWDTSAAQAASAVCANEGQPLSRSAWETSVPGITYRAPCS
jgi:WD40 repeat protein